MSALDIIKLIAFVLQIFIERGLPAIKELIEKLKKSDAVTVEEIMALADLVPDPE